MTKAYEVMTHGVITCPPETHVAHVAELMRDHDIGDVLIVENGELRGIVTDRDLAVQALTGKSDPQQDPIKKYMSTNLITGETNWDLDQVAKKMAKHQIRRLPIVQDSQLVGIISLGDVAVYENNKGVVKKSLQEISKPNGNSGRHRVRGSRPSIGLPLVALVGAAALAAFFTRSNSGQVLRKKMAKTKLYHNAQSAVNTARGRVVDEAKSSKFLQDLLHQIQDFTSQLSTVEYKPRRRKFLFFG